MNVRKHFDANGTTCGIMLDLSPLGDNTNAGNTFSDAEMILLSRNNLSCYDETAGIQIAAFSVDEGGVVLGNPVPDHPDVSENKANGPCILLLSRDSDAFIQIASMLQHDGYPTSFLSSGVRGVNFLRQTAQPHIVLFNMQLAPNDLLSMFLELEQTPKLLNKHRFIGVSDAWSQIPRVTLRLMQHLQLSIATSHDVRDKVGIIVSTIATSTEVPTGSSGE